jgi:hypothetical protein
MTGALAFSAELRVVIYLSVEHHAVPIIFAAHGLLPSLGQVDDRKTGESQARRHAARCIAFDTSRVRPTMLKRSEYVIAEAGSTSAPNVPGDTTHGGKLLMVKAD